MQKFIAEKYELILRISKTVTNDYEDLAHDLILKFAKDDRITKIPEEKLPAFIHRSAKNLHIDQIRAANTERETEKSTVESGDSPDPYEYIERIQKSELNEIERLWLNIYLDHGGNYVEVSKSIRVSRQTISKHVKAACRKLRS